MLSLTIRWFTSDIRLSSPETQTPSVVCGWEDRHDKSVSGALTILCNRERPLRPCLVLIGNSWVPFPSPSMFSSATLGLFFIFSMFRLIAASMRLITQGWREFSLMKMATTTTAFRLCRNEAKEKSLGRTPFYNGILIV